MKDSGESFKSLKVRASVHHAVKIAASRLGISVRQLVEEALRDHLTRLVQEELGKVPGMVGWLG